MISQLLVLAALGQHPVDGRQIHQHALADQANQSMQWNDRRNGYGPWGYGQPQQAKQAPAMGWTSGSPGCWGFHPGATDAAGRSVPMFHWETRPR